MLTNWIFLTILGALAAPLILYLIYRIIIIEKYSIAELKKDSLEGYSSFNSSLLLIRKVKYTYWFCVMFLPVNIIIYKLDKIYSFTDTYPTINWILIIFSTITSVVLFSITLNRLYNGLKYILTGQFIVYKKINVKRN